MNIDVKSIHSLTDFKRNASELVNHARESGHPLVLTVNGRAEAVLLDAETYQDMVDQLEEARTAAALRRMDRGEGRPARKVLAEIRKRYVRKRSEKARD